MRPRKLVPVAAGLTVLLAVAACSSDSTTDDSAAPAPAASGEALNLKGICPDTVVIQTDWFPESEYGFLYQLLGPGYTIDKAKKRVSGPLVASGQDTGVKVEIRTGGPAIGFQTGQRADVRGQVDHARPGRHRRGDPELGQAADARGASRRSRSARS